MGFLQIFPSASEAQGGIAAIFASSNGGPGEVIVHPGNMVMPPVMFGLIAFGALLLLIGITWSFRHMANRHPERSPILPFQPVIHKGQSIEEHSAH